MPDVITLQFDNAVNDKGVKPVRYMEGHYLYLQCPAVDGINYLRGPLNEWHPFTISSAPDEPVSPAAAGLSATSPLPLLRPSSRLGPKLRLCT